jgi:phage terminase small subunit
MENLNDRQRRFAELLVSGIGKAEAYQQAGYKARGHAAESSACNLLRKAEVKAYRASLQKEAKSKSVLSVTERLEMLTRIAERTEIESPGDSMKATDQISKMDGAYSAAKVEIDTSDELGDLLRRLPSA